MTLPSIYFQITPTTYYVIEMFSHPTHIFSGFEIKIPTKILSFDIKCCSRSFKDIFIEIINVWESNIQ